MRESSRATQTYSMASGPRGSTSHSEISLTPETIATLASLMPSNHHTSTPVCNNIPVVSSTPIWPSFSANGIQENQPAYVASQLEYRVSNDPHQSQQSRGQYNMQQSVVFQYPAYNNSIQPQNIPPISAASTGHLSNYSHERLNATSSYTQGQAATVLQNHLGSNAGYSGQSQNGQEVPTGGSSDNVEKNQIYQSTLLIAANLLQQQFQQNRQNGD